ncbi:MAG: carboxypeptidase-like regulatory domain-containing protein, partial [Planctomycetota bacterium]
MGAGPVFIDILTFERDATVTGRVLDALERPVAGAHIEGKLGKAVSGGDGSFEILVASRAYGDLRAWADGHGQAQLFIEDTEAGGGVDVEFRLPPELTIAGTVRDAMGVPVPGADVRVLGDSLGETKSDSAGRFRLTSLSHQPGKSVTVSAKSPLYRSQSHHVDMTASTPRIDLDFELERGLEIRGIVMAPDGAPVAGAEVWTGFDPYAWDRVVTYTNDAGMFRLDGAASGKTLMGASAHDWPAIERVLQLSAGGDVTLRFEEPRVLRGIVQDESGTPIQGVGVSAKRDGSYLDSSAITKADGRFELSGFGSEGRFGIDAFGSGWIRSELDVPADAFDADADDFVVTLKPAGVLSGVVTDASTGEPLTHFTVRIAWPEWPAGRPDGAEAIHGVDSSWYRPGKTFNDGAGRWSTDASDGLRPGRWAMVEVSSPGYALLRLDAVEVMPADAPIDTAYALQRPVSVSVTVTSGDEPVASARIVGTNAKDPRPADPSWSATTGA